MIVGDRVKVNAGWSTFHGRIGTIVSVVEASGQVRGWVVVDFDDGKVPMRFGLGEVEVVG